MSDDPILTNWDGGVWPGATCKPQRFVFEGLVQPVIG
jgi:hypothetical protein